MIKVPRKISFYLFKVYKKELKSFGIKSELMSQSLEEYLQFVALLS